MAGGTGSRLWPLTKSVSKQLLPVYDKPMIYYPLSTLMLAGIREILVICSPDYLDSFKNLLGDGSALGLMISYKVQEHPNGLAEAFILGEEFIGDQNVCLVLGDNLFFGPGVGTSLSRFSEMDGGTVFAYWVKNPQDYGVVEFDSTGRAVSIEEKPKLPKSNYVVPGLYFYDNKVASIAKKLRPSSRGELEISDLNQEYLKSNNLRVEVLPRGTAWLDTGNFEALAQATEFVRTVEQRQGLKIACPEEIAWKSGYIDDEQLRVHASSLMKSGYGEYLFDVLARGKN